MNYVVGSGPTGVSAAMALAQKGFPVTILDVGGELEPEVQSRVSRLTERPEQDWTADDLCEVKGKLRYNSEGTPLKLLFGSDFPYREVERWEPTTAQGVDVYRGMAKGGLSSLWGASVLPYNAEDLEGWPIPVEELQAHYRAVLEMTGLSGEADELEKLYPLYVRPDTSLRPSRQAVGILSRMRERKESLASHGIYFGRSRLAIRARAGRACTHCGLCLYGCPYGLIYSSNQTLDDNQAIRYLSGVHVRSIRENATQVLIEAVDRSGNTQSFTGDRVYLAAGVFSSTRILMESEQSYDQPQLISQSDHFLIPLLLQKSSGDVTQERLHALCQVYLGFQAGRVSRKATHLQIYTFNDYMVAMARQKLGFIYPAVSPIVRRLYGRIALAKGYFHSDESSRIRATLRRTQKGSVLALESAAPIAQRASLRSVTRELLRRSRETGFIPVGFAARLGSTGSGVHVGGSRPMSSNPQPGQSDRLGRPYGWKRLHLVDSSSFPSVPASTITLTAMANAHRIAALSVHS